MMNDAIEVSAKTVDEAVKQALAELNISIDDIEFEIIDEPSKKFLGLLGGKPAKIKAWVKSSRLKTTKIFLEDVTRNMGIKTTVMAEEDGELYKISLEGGQLGSIIGRRGETLDSLQYLANLVANKNASERKRVILDAEGYRKRREETLISLAHKVAERVKRTGQEIVLEPMSSQERRVIHTALQQDSMVQTFSEGEEPFRKVVISMKGNI